MMDKCDVVRLALVFSVQAEIEGMKVENMREPNTFSLKDFLEKSEKLANIAYVHNDQL